MRNKQLVIVAMIISMLSLAFQWPWDVQQQAQAKKKSSQTSSSPKDEVKEAIQSTKSTTGTPVKISTQNQKGKAGGPSLLKGAGETDFAKDEASVSSKNAAEIGELQKRIENIIKVNESLKAASGPQAKDIAEISDQARAHQKILTQLNAPNNVVPAYRASDAGEVLRQEKLRLIQDQTQKNQNAIETIKRSETLRR